MSLTGYPTINDIGLIWLIGKLCETEKWDERDRARAEHHKTVCNCPPRRMIWQVEENAAIAAMLAAARQGNEPPSPWERDPEPEEDEEIEK